MVRICLKDVPSSLTKFPITPAALLPFNVRGKLVPFATDKGIVLSPALFGCQLGV